jgi:hypothetical protein
MVRVWFNIRGNKWVNDGRINYFVNLDAWKIEPAGKSEPVDAYNSGNRDASPVSGSSSDTEDDMPF